MNEVKTFTAPFFGCTRRKAALACLTFLALLSSGCGDSKDEPAAVAAPLPNAGENLRSAVYPYPEHGAVLGQGWDTFSDSPTSSSCVEVDAVQLERSTYKSNVEQVISTYSLLEDVTTSVSASYKGTGMKASGSATATRSKHVKSDAMNFLFTFESADGSTFAVAPGTVKNHSVMPGEQTVKLMGALKGEMAQERYAQALSVQLPSYAGASITLTDQAKLLLEKNPSEFRRRCGEGFVAAIHRGTRIQLLISQTNASKEDKKLFSATLSASGYGGSAKASYSSSTATNFDTAKLHYSTFQEGGVPLAPVALTGTDAASLRTSLEKILPTPDKLQSNPTAFRVVVVPYANISAEAASNLPTPLQLFSVSDYYIALTDLYDMAGGIIEQIRADVSAAKETPAFNTTLVKAYGGLQQLERVRDTIHRDLILLEAFLQLCYEGQAAGSRFLPGASEAKLKAGEECTIQGASRLLKQQIQTYASNVKPQTPPPEAGASGVAAWNAVTSDVQKALSAASGVLSAQVNRQLVEVTSNLRSEQEKRIATESLNAAKTQKADALGQTMAKLAEASEDANFSAFVADLVRYRESLETEGLSEEFFYRFYWYLVQLPIPETGIRLTLATAQNTDAEKKKLVDNARKIITESVLNQRLKPWHDFFCNKLKSEPLCTPESDLRSLAETSAALLSVGDIAYEPPPAPPAKKKKRCKFGRGVWC